MFELSLLRQSGDNAGGGCCMTYDPNTHYPTHDWQTPPEPEPHASIRCVMCDDWFTPETDGETLCGPCMDEYELEDECPACAGEVTIEEVE